MFVYQIEQKHTIMKKVFLIITGLATMLLTSCYSELKEGVAKAKDIDNAGRSLFEAEYDGCQYIIYDGYHKSGIVHKGNCSNKAHLK